MIKRPAVSHDEAHERVRRLTFSSDISSGYRLGDYIEQHRARDDRPDQSLQWAVDTFGPVAKLKSERAMRFLEEAIELAQACGVDMQHCDRILWRVFTRPAGSAYREIGQSLMCLEALAASLNISANDECDAELALMKASDPAERRARHAEKVRLGIATDPDSVPL